MAGLLLPSLTWKRKPSLLQACSHDREAEAEAVLGVLGRPSQGPVRVGSHLPLSPPRAIAGSLYLDSTISLNFTWHKPNHYSQPELKGQETIFQNEDAQALGW